MKRQFETTVCQPSAKKAKVSDNYGRTVESMDVEEDLFCYLFRKSSSATRPFLKATRGLSNRRLKITSNPIMPLNSWIKKREGPLTNIDERPQLKKTKTIKQRNAAISVDVEKDIVSIFMRLHL
ncbi:uncharacterized protein LOC128187474 [Crassostrea angulata]|uniref:uncharacterized protein LOC128187474 n=1 Tax=Magallana angulata TaxID=2784310 RepID=UPI0022B189A8|nr:uncharacterized protein LOC128187474 [Crassostrea angulata]